MQCESTEDDLSNIMEWYPFNNNTLLQCESTEDDLSNIMEWYPFNNITSAQDIQINATGHIVISSIK